MTEYSFNEGAAPKEVQVAPEGSDHGTSYDIAEKVEYSLQPFVDQTEMWENVTTSLLGGGTIGIFPEGGTHDGEGTGGGRYPLQHAHEITSCRAIWLSFSSP